MTTTPSLRTAILAAALAVALPLSLQAQGAVNDDRPAPLPWDEEKENREPARKPAADHAAPACPVGGQAARIGPVFGGTPTELEAPRGVQPWPNGFVTLNEKSVLFRVNVSRATTLFQLDHEAAAWWAMPDGSGILYTFEGKLRFKPADAAVAEKEIGEAPAGAVAISAMGRTAAWLSSGSAMVAAAGGEAPRKIAPPDGRDFASLALSNDGARLFATLRPHGVDGANEIASMALAGDAKWETLVKSKEGTLACLSACNDGASVLFTQVVTAGAKVRTAVQYLAKGQTDPATLAWAEAVTEVFPASDSRHAWFSSKGVNGRRKIFRAELELRPEATEYVTECVVQADDADCAGLTRAVGRGTAFYLEKRDGAADRVGILSGF